MSERTLDADLLLEWLDARRAAEEGDSGTSPSYFTGWDFAFDVVRAHVLTMIGE